MSSTRVKLIFERPLVKSPEQCWMLVDRNSCKMVRDLEYLIAKKFFVAGHTILNLYLDDFLLPSHEKIDLIRDNEVIRVIEDRNIVLSNKTSGDSDCKQRIGTSKKRKHEESSGSKRKIKKAKHSLNNELTAENNVNSSITDKQLNANVIVDNDLKTTEKSTVTNAQKEKPKKNKNLKVDANAKTKQKKLKKKQPSKDKSIVTRLNDFLGKVSGNRNQLNPTFSPKKSNGPENCTTEEKHNGTILSETSADNERAQELMLTSEVQKNNELQQSLSKEGSNKKMPNENQNGTPQRSQGNHIRFDNDENDLSSDVLNNAVQPITHPQILSLRQTNAPRPSGTPNLSPIEPNTQSCFSSKTSVNGPNGKFNNQKGTRGRHGKDSYTNRSQILESTRVDKDAQQQSLDLQSTTAQAVKKDFSVYSLLHGPPRVGDTVAFKMIEMSQSYTPEVSKYKEGQVMSFDPVSKQFTLKLTKESLERVKGDGHVSSKFEIFENSEDDGEGIGAEEMSDEIQIQWLSMFEPRLVHS